MTSRDFAFWLQGYFEVAQPTEIKEDQLKVIQNHLNLVFKHEIDPSMGDEKHQHELNGIHNLGKIDLNKTKPSRHDGELLRC